MGGWLTYLREGGHDELGFPSDALGGLTEVGGDLFVGGWMGGWVVELL